MKIDVKETTPDKIKMLIWDLLDIFTLIGIPTTGSHRSLERMAKACLAVGGVKNGFKESISVNARKFLRTRDIIDFENQNYGENISSGSYDDIRRKDLKFLLEAGVVVSSASSNSQAVNNPSRGYALSEIFVSLLHSYGSLNWENKANDYIITQTSLQEKLKRLRNLEKVPVTLPNGKELRLSYGEHNSLQKAIIEEFLPRFGFGAIVLYVGDTEDKFLHVEKEFLEDIHFFSLSHEELPDVIAYSKDKNLLYLIEAYHSTGEWNEVRLKRVQEKLKEAGCTAIPVYFTAFENKVIFRKKVRDIAWETDVWIADNPDHLVHFNGYKFLEIHKGDHSTNN